MAPTRRTLALLCGFVVLAAVGPAGVGLTTVSGATTDHLACSGGDDGAVFGTDSGLIVIHERATLETNPFVNETTLAFANVTVSAADDASVRVVSASREQVCLRAVAPTNASLTVRPAAGPTVVVAGGLDSLAYGRVDYAANATAELAYETGESAEIEIVDGDLDPGRTVAAIEGETVLASGTVTDERTVTLSLPAGDHSVDLRHVVATPTPTPTPAATLTPTPDPPATPRTTPTPAVNGSGGNGQSGGGNASTITSPGSDTGGFGPDITAPVPEVSTGSLPQVSFEWTGEMVDYQPSQQTQHVGGFLPLAVLLALLALWLLLTRHSTEARLLAGVLAVAALRAASDLLQVTIDGIESVETSLAALNLALELWVAVLFVQFAAAYAGVEQLRTRRAKAGAAVLAVVGAAGILTNPIHGQVFADVAVVTGPFTYVATVPAPAGWLVIAFNIAAVTTGGALVLRAILGASISAVWRPVAVIATGLGLAVAVGVASILNLGPVPGYDYTAAGVNYFLLLTTTTLLAHGLKQLKTSGEESVIADLEDAIVILDDAWTIVEFNDAAARLFPDVDRGLSFDRFLSLARPTGDESVERELQLQVGPDRLTDGRGPPDPWTNGGLEGDRLDEAPMPADGDEDRSEDDESGAPSEFEWGPGRTKERAEGHAGSEGEHREGDPERGPEGGQSDTGRDRRGAEETTAGPEADRTGEPAVAGGRRDFLVEATTVTTETGDVIGYAVRFADVTQLKDQIRELEAKNDQLDQFAGAITQDLRSPLDEAEAATGRAVELLEAAGDPEAVDRASLHEHLSTTGNALRGIAQTVEDILGLVRDSGLEINEETVSFDRIADAAWEAVAPETATLQVESGGEITADPDHLRRIFEQLFENAVENAGPDVTVRIGLTDDGFSVVDDGPGVPRRLQGRLFEQGVTTKDTGSGLGLAIARQRAQAQDWTIEHVTPDGPVAGPDTHGGLSASPDDEGQAAHGAPDEEKVGETGDESTADASDDDGARFVVRGCETSPESADREVDG
ncbi:MAG: ATP-binding protein [Haloarculaceae archaeon]